MRSDPLSLTILLLAALPAHAGDLPAGFVRLADIDPTIRQDMRYAGSADFLGRPAKGYEAPVCILTEPAAKALAEVQKQVASEGLTLVVFDCYRPIQAVDDLVSWAMEGGPPDPRWYPQVKRGDLIAEGYIGARSSHSRGSTVDLALGFADPNAPAPRDPDCGAQNARTLEFGTGFDCFDQRSHTGHTPFPEGVTTNRTRLVAAMRKGGFRNYAKEWWHFTLKNEPYKDQRFDFPVTDAK